MARCYLWIYFHWQCCVKRHISVRGDAGIKTCASRVALIFIALVIWKPKDESILEWLLCDGWGKWANGGKRERRLNWTKGLDWNLRNVSFISLCFTLNKSLICLIWHWLTSNKMSFLLAWFPSAWHLSAPTPAGPWQRGAGPLILLPLGSQLCLHEWQLLSDRLADWWLCICLKLCGEVQCKIDNLHPSVPSLVLLRNELPSTVLGSSLAGSLPPHWTQFCFLHGGVLLLLLWMTSQAFSCFRVTLAVCWVHLVSVCFLQGPVYELPSYVLTAVTLLLSWIWFLANVVQL